MDWMYGFRLRKFLPLPARLCEDVTLIKATCWNQWNSEERDLKIPIGSRGTAGGAVGEMKTCS